ncbi:hypothetical protein CWS01_20050 [Niallia nealsonii]|uniref:Uncharacterized protein n=1 Tax=Niallia nealsonii TaxID=115979 RepID=A0A2N0YXD0_9BACI|nr:hypothetical protein CWS01_20050 [Niallia nealsonii]
MILFPNQICPEYKHPTRTNGDQGKQETFRCRAGKVYLYVKTKQPKVYLPEKDLQYYMTWQEIVLQ